MAYNPYSDIEKVYNAKVGWNNATTDEERKRQNEIANAARKNLEAYGYSDVANQISASGADATTARQILEKYSPNATVETNNSKSTEVNRENAGLFDKYNKSYEDLTKTNPFTTDEAKAILGKYSLAGLQARDNAVASGGATNGGNIDSYAASNAMRQQSALIGQGQSKVLEAHQQKIDNIRGLLSDMGVNIDRVFNQDETAKNNETARLEVQAGVTGYTPNEWTIKNDDIYSMFLNEDGTFKKEQEGVDIQALINQAKASGDTETAKKLSVVRTKKILSNYGEFGKYANEGDISSMTPQQTEAGRQFDEQNKTARETLKAESDLTKYEIDTKKAIEDNANATKLTLGALEASANGGDDYAAYNTLLSMFDVSETRKRGFIEKHLKPIYEGKESITPEGLKQLILTNSEKYNIDVDDARLLCRAFGVDTSWLDGYRDRTDDDGILENGEAGRYGGMVKK